MANSKDGSSKDGNSKINLNADDEDLFRRAVDEATRLSPNNRAPNYKPKPVARARFRQYDEQDVLRESLAADIEEIETGAGESLQFQRPIVGRLTMRKLQRGKFSVQDEIDLHGLTVTEAKICLREFIQNATQQGYSCVRVVHGKGYGSGQRGPVLKTKVNQWLRHWNEVLAFASTRQTHGGTGALYVLLRI